MNDNNIELRELLPAHPQYPSSPIASPLSVSRRKELTGCIMKTVGYFYHQGWIAAADMSSKLGQLFLDSPNNYAFWIINFSKLGQVFYQCGIYSWSNFDRSPAQRNVSKHWALNEALSAQWLTANPQEHVDDLRGNNNDMESYIQYFEENPDCFRSNELAYQLAKLRGKLHDGNVSLTTLKVSLAKTNKTVLKSFFMFSFYMVQLVASFVLFFSVLYDKNNIRDHDGPESRMFNTAEAIGFIFPNMITSAKATLVSSLSSGLDAAWNIGKIFSSYLNRRGVLKNKDNNIMYHQAKILRYKGLLWCNYLFSYHLESERKRYLQGVCNQAKYQHVPYGMHWDEVRLKAHIDNVVASMRGNNSASRIRHGSPV